MRIRSRVASAVIDALFAGDIYIILSTLLVAFVFGLTDFRGVVDATLAFTFLLFPLAYFIWTTAWVLYGFAGEAATGKTIGKKLLGIRVVQAGMKPSIFRLFLRNLLKYVDAVGFGLVGLISLLTLKRTVGDVASGLGIEKE